MTTTVPTPTGTAADDVVAAAASLAPAITARAAEVEQLRRLPADLLDQLVAAGCFRMLLPQRQGGVEAELPAAMAMVETLSRADASVGWTVMIGSATWIDLAGLPAATFDGLYAAGPDVMIAGAFAPGGGAVPVDGGYRVSGRWAFASGSPHAQWLYGNCLEETGGEPRLRICLFDLEQAEVEDTWHVVGLRGTGSHHFHVDNVIVPAERTWLSMECHPPLDAVVVRIPPPALFSLLIGSMVVGVARGALDDITALAGSRSPLLAGAPLAANATFQHQLAVADTDLRAVRSLLFDLAGEAWATAAAGAEPSLALRAHIRAAAVRAAQTATGVVTIAYRAGGSHALHLDSPLQRRLRDIHAAGQHFLVRDDTMTTAGAVLAGQEIHVPVF